MGGDSAPLSGPDLRKGIAASEIGDGAVVLGHADGEPVLLARCGRDLYAVGARCTHYGGPLAEGLLVGETIRCPWHHAAFSVRTGAATRPPALSDLQCWKVEQRDGLAVVTGKRAAPEEAPPPRLDVESAPDSVMIIGGGAAGAVAAQTLRRAGFGGSITILEAGPHFPVDRPNLSKDYLAGTAPEDWIPLRPESFWTESEIEIVRGRSAAAIDPVARRVTLDDGTSRPFAALLIATGATPVPLDMPNAGQHVHYLRSLTDARAIIGAASGARRAVVIGASFIGLEVAASLRARGLEVTVVAPEARPLERVLGPELGDFVHRLHEEHGVRFRLRDTAAKIGATTVTLGSGATLDADLVVAGIGVRPNVELAAAAGLPTDRGILVDEYLETSVPGVFAAGDVARWRDFRTGERMRVEHWVVAQRQGQTAARNILAGRSRARERFDAVPFFWSQHYDVAIAYVGHAATWDSVEIDGDLAARDCAVTYRVQGRTVAVATIFRDRESLAAERAMEVA